MPSEDLAHYGVKGMHWGVKKARTGVIDQQTRNLDKVASGNASFLRKAATAASFGPVDLARHGLKKAAASRSANLKAQRARLAAGEATTKDILKAWGTVGIVDIIRSMHD